MIPPPLFSTYLRDVLINVASVDDDDDIDEVFEMIERFYVRSFLAPKSNIGTLSLVAKKKKNTCHHANPDTTRVIERLTQARLSRFHTTFASVCCWCSFFFSWS